MLFPFQTPSKKYLYGLETVLLEMPLRRVMSSKKYLYGLETRIDFLPLAGKHLL